jgi:chromosome partitioning protein
MATNIISIVNQKGGTGKTSTTVNLGCALAKLGKKVLLVDFDSQGNLTYYLGVLDYKHTIADVLWNEQKLKDIWFEREGLYVVPGDNALANAELSLANAENREFFLKKILEKETGFDYILIDCGPSRSLLTVNALTASNGVIIPMQMEVLSLQGLAMVVKTIFQIKESLNEQLSIWGILPVMVDKRRKVTSEIYEYLRENYGIRIFSNAINVDVKAVEAPSFGQSVVSYAPSSPSAQGYLAFAQELTMA